MRRSARSSSIRSGFRAMREPHRTWHATSTRNCRSRRRRSRRTWWAAAIGVPRCRAARRHRILPRRRSGQAVPEHAIACVRGRFAHQHAAADHTPGHGAFVANAATGRRGPLPFPRPRTAGERDDPDRPLVPREYGDEPLENMEPSGGLTAAATDLVRVLTAMNARPYTPLGRPAVDSLLQRASVNGRNGHGFDYLPAIGAGRAAVRRTEGWPPPDLAERPLVR